jgi:hypothetical protein
MQWKMVLHHALVLTINKGPQNRILQILQNYTLQYDELKRKSAAYGFILVQWGF